MQFLNFKKTNCKNCYKCLRGCPVKAITVLNHQAQINENMCILCGKCTTVCHQNAKEVAGELSRVRELLAGDKPVFVSVAPSFVSSFDTAGFGAFRSALKACGFAFAEETARGAKRVVAEYKKLLDSGTYKNLIASACPSAVRLIQMYYPEALKYLAPVDSPMIAHAKLLRKEHGDAVRIVFVGPCIAKKREAYESGLIDAVLTFEELEEFFREKNVNPADFDNGEEGEGSEEVNAVKNAAGANCAGSALGNRAKYFPINRGIIKSFNGFTEGYEYISIDGVERCCEVLGNIDRLSGMFIEMNACEFSCINGPCALNKDKGGFIKATEAVRSYVKKDVTLPQGEEEEADIAQNYPRISVAKSLPSEKQIKDILASIGKTKPEDELNCGACGYNTCREKAVAVYNGWAEREMCVPFMRERAESMSYEIIRNSPNGIIAVDGDYRIVDINPVAKQLLNIKEENPKGRLLVEFYNPTDFFLVRNEGKNISRKQIFIEATGKYVEMSITLLKSQNLLFCIMKDITSDVNYEKLLDKVKRDTVAVTDKVVEKQMRVVQEIASLLGETTAETKVALIKLKKTMLGEDGKGGDYEAPEGYVYQGDGHAEDPK